MVSKVPCSCGQILTAPEGALFVVCSCGNTVGVSVAGAGASQAITAATPATVPTGGSTADYAEDPTGELDLRGEIIAPRPIRQRVCSGQGAGKIRRVVAALTPDGIWLQDTWQTRLVLSRDIVACRRCGHQVELTLSPTDPDGLTLIFDDTAETDYWVKELDLAQQRKAGGLPSERKAPEGVSLVRNALTTPHVVVGRIEFTGPTQWAADRGLQLRAGMLGANAIIDVYRQKSPEMGWGARHVSGMAIRVDNAEARTRLRLRWYAEEVGALVNRLLLLLILQAGLLFAAVGLRTSDAHLNGPTGQTRAEALAGAGLGLALLYAWPLVLMVLLRTLRWPQLLRAAGLGVLAATTGRGLIICLAHLLAMNAKGATLRNSTIWMVLDPVDWVFIIAGVVLFKRAWRLAREAQAILPSEVQAVPLSRLVWSRSILALTCVYGLVLLGLVGIGRYETSVYVLQPGVDPRREHEALLVLNEGMTQAEKGDLAAAERSFQKALLLWEGLVKLPQAPAAYRANLVLTLHHLGWLREGDGRLEEAEPHYARAAALAEQAAGEGPMQRDEKEIMANARQALATLRAAKAARALDEKDRMAVRKYEEGQVKAEQGEAGMAELLFREAIAIWEEILPGATNKDYRKFANERLGIAYLDLGDMQRRVAKGAAAEASLIRSIDFLEKALAAEPARQQLRRDLEAARRLLDGLRK